MKVKIVKVIGCKTCKEVLVSVSRKEDGDDYVELQAWHKNTEGDWYQFQEIDFPTLELASAYVKDFSSSSASEFAKEFNF